MHVAGQHIGAGLPQAESKVTGEFRVGDAAHAVGSEQSGHWVGSFPGSGPKNIVILAVIHQDAPEAVSYTHLDVYKRQLVHGGCDRS